MSKIVHKHLLQDLTTGEVKMYTIVCYPNDNNFIKEGDNIYPIYVDDKGIWFKGTPHKLYIPMEGVDM